MTTSQLLIGTGDLLVIDALGPKGDYRTRAREVITDTAGEAMAELCMVPSLYVSRTISAQRKVRPLPVAQRQAALERAADIFVDTVVAGLDFDAYVEMVSRVSGLPISVARAQIREVAGGLVSAFESVWPAQPTGAAFDWREGRTRHGCAVWARRGEMFAAHASGNAPGVHALWPQALALGYRVAIRPSRREPFTGHRLTFALRHGGFRPEDVVYLPTDYAGADEIIRAADLAMVYGGQDVVDKYANDPTVFPNGPGRTKTAAGGLDHRLRTPRIIQRTTQPRDVSAERHPRTHRRIHAPHSVDQILSRCQSATAQQQQGEHPALLW
jgi:acyl-CoA reductase-like NAD-dependent aldehyde dehydrogenase